MLRCRVMRTLLKALATVAAASCWLGATPAAADGGWLDEPVLEAWNQPGQGIPAAPPAMSAPNPLCDRLHRPAETAEDAAVETAGWTLFATYESGWGIRVVHGLVGHDGMCRPLDFQTFVFVNGVFAGTISPVPMNARTDGAESSTVVSAPGDLLVSQFARYGASDPLCCPSRISIVQLRLEQSGEAPVLLPGAVSTAPGAP
jgi:LppP/LprE lipoprotein